MSLPASGQSLADVARAEAERRKAIAQPSRVYTNRDLKPVVSPGALPDAEAGEASPEVPRSAITEKPDRASPRAADGEANGATGKEGRDDENKETRENEEKRRTEEEQQWRARLAQARDRVERSRTFAEALQSRINALNADFAARDDPAQRAAIGTQLNKALAELERVKGDIEAQETAVTDLEEEARRAGVPPGWLR